MIVSDATTWSITYDRNWRNWLSLRLELIKHITIVNNDSRVVRMTIASDAMPQIRASITIVIGHTNQAND
jgi:hypothetical protein